MSSQLNFCLSCASSLFVVYWVALPYPRSRNTEFEILLRATKKAQISRGSTLKHVEEKAIDLILVHYPPFPPPNPHAESPAIRLHLPYNGLRTWGPNTTGGRPPYICTNWHLCEIELYFVVLQIPRNPLIADVDVNLLFSRVYEPMSKK